MPQVLSLPTENRFTNKIIDFNNPQQVPEEVDRGRLFTFAFFVPTDFPELGFDNPPALLHAFLQGISGGGVSVPELRDIEVLEEVVTLESAVWRLWVPRNFQMEPGNAVNAKFEFVELVSI